jgi:hypothetical protein
MFYCLGGLLLGCVGTSIMTTAVLLSKVEMFAIGALITLLGYAVIFASHIDTQGVI